MQDLVDFNQVSTKPSCLQSIQVKGLQSVMVWFIPQTWDDLSRPTLYFLQCHHILPKAWTPRLDTIFQVGTNVGLVEGGKAFLVKVGESPLNDPQFAHCLACSCSTLLGTFTVFSNVDSKVLLFYIVGDLLIPKVVFCAIIGVAHVHALAFTRIEPK